MLICKEGWSSCGASDHDRYLGDAGPVLPIYFGGKRLPTRSSTFEVETQGHGTARDGYVLATARGRCFEVRLEVAQVGLESGGRGAFGHRPGQIAKEGSAAYWPDGTRAGTAVADRRPDGRGREVVVGADSWQCTMVDSDGERDTFTRPIKTGWEVETVIAAQLRAGLVDV